MKALKVAVVVVIAFSCSKDKDPGTVDSEFQPYVDSFNNEAASRNIDVDEVGLIAGFVDQSEIPNYCGYGSVNPPHVKISKTTTCWSSQTDINKEILFFHEMGHAVLKRLHINDTLPNGDYKSMMFDGNQFDLYSAQDEQRRNYYLDELFNPGTPAPAWATKKTNAQSFYSTAFDNNSQGDWLFQNSGSDITGTVEDGSVKLSGAYNPSDGFAFWEISFNPDGEIPIGSRVVLKVKVKIDKVTGPGVFIALRGDRDQSAVFFQTTQDKIIINGTSDFKEYSIAQPYFPAAIKILHVYLILNGDTSGSVQFDDVELVVLQ